MNYIGIASYKIKSAISDLEKSKIKEARLLGIIDRLKIELDELEKLIKEKENA